jgi:hypothetical protein
MSTRESLTSGDEERGRHLSLWLLLGIVVVYLVILQAGARLIGPGIGHDDSFKTLHNLLLSGLIPIAISAVYAIAVATWLGWWPQILREQKPVQRWVRAVPIALLIAALLGTSWASLLDQKAGLIIAFVAMVLTVGFTEELMFRGIGLLTFRGMAISEARVALYSSVLFGAVHLSNALATGGTAVAQAIIVSFSGYLFYLTRRSFLAIGPAMLVHSSQDFALLSGKIGIHASMAPQAFLIILTMLGLAILLIRRRHRINLESPESPDPHGSGVGAPAF